MRSESSARRPDRRALIGRLGEDLAAEYVAGLGWSVLERNWRCRYGELDMIATDRDGQESVLVIVEVKTRASRVLGDPAEAVTADKLSRIRRLTRLWLADQDAFWPTIRVDVVSVQLDPHHPERTELAALRHHRGVFE
ncbi:YraN family protein [Gordonia otitidis]|uniref:YraN family protein n=1 Tax=Gordonia otitidis TaxID=249058 RepID=UPI000587483F|nr:YraN family protein [Gordonia otitidis]